MADQSAFRRQWNLLQLLASRRAGLTVKQLSAEVGVSVKTMRRDLEMFVDFGLQVRESVGEFGRKSWHVPADFATKLALNFDPAVAAR